jgi:hypothetical protein
MGQQFAGMTGVFSGNQVNFLENTDSPEGHILQITDRCSHNVEGSAHYLSEKCSPASRQEYRRQSDHERPGLSDGLFGTVADKANLSQDTGHAGTHQNIERSLLDPQVFGVRVLALAVL